MINRSKADSFYESLDGLRKKMLTVAGDVENKKDCLKNSLENMSVKINSLSVIDREVAKNNKKMYENCLLVFDDIKNATKQWKTEFEEILNQESFRNEFKDSFLVIIYGKVKAGKSSFGNFIADSCLDTQKAIYFKYDEAGENRKEIAELEEIDDEVFDVKNTEATIEIQGFRLSGLTWIDTPGLASMTAVNGALAKEYIESADLIIYPVSSDAPGRKTDTHEILELFDKNKTVNVVITKSDKPKKQVVDGKLVKVIQNKTSENRKKQEEYVFDEIKSSLPDDKMKFFGNIYSLSVHTAKKAMDDNDRELYISSQVDMFFEQMINIIKSDALELKTKAPHNRLKSFVDLQVIGSTTTQKGSLQQIRKALENIDLSREDVLKNLYQEKENLKGDFSLHVETEVDKRFAHLNKDNTEKVLKEILTTVQVSLQAELKIVIENALDGFNNSILALNFQLDSKDFSISDIKEKYKYNDSNLKKNIGTALAVLGGGLLAAWAIANFWNPTGWLAGAGAIAVETAVVTGAGYAGGKAGESFGEDKEEEIVVGNNKDEILSKIKISVQNLIDDNINSVIEQLDNTYFKPISDFSNSMINIIDNLESNLKRCIND